MSQDSVLKLIIVDDSLNDAEQSVSSLRSLGMAIKSTRVEDADDFIDALASTECDLILCSLESAQLPLADIVTHLNEHRDSVPIIAMTSAEFRHPTGRCHVDRCRGPGAQGQHHAPQAGGGT